MGIWIVLLVAASGLSGWAGYALALRGAPKRSELDALAAELEAAREQAESVQANVNEHFEQSARLFGKLAKDYREFLDHFSGSAQALGLSEARARELIEEGFRPLITHEQDPDLVPAEGESEAVSGGESPAPAEPVVATDPAEEALPEKPDLVAEVVVEMPGEAPAPREAVAGEDEPATSATVKAEPSGRQAAS